jgi:hypothetical protein
MPRRTIWLVLLWTLFVLYPNPARLVVSAVHAAQPVIDPDAVRDLLPTLPDDPHAIERVVNSKLVSYAVPWETYGVPWYFPTPREVLTRGEGDCQARAVVFASILQAKGIPARLVGSFDHLWVDYPGKQENALENTAVAIASQQPDGSYALRWPSLIEWRTSWQIERAYFWDAMPAARLWLLVGGWVVIIQLRRLSLAALLAGMRDLLKRQPVATS